MNNRSDNGERDNTGAALTHLDARGRAAMVDVADKAITSRMAIAEGSVRMERQTLRAIETGNVKKGDVFATARLGGLMGAKQTASLIPLCHPLMLDSVQIDIDVDAALPGLRVRATVRVHGRTGVEMEALTAVSVACLCIYDMAKALDRRMRIGEIHLVEKAGGRSGHFRRADDPASGRGGNI